MTLSHSDLAIYSASIGNKLLHTSRTLLSSAEGSGTHTHVLIIDSPSQTTL